jgi:membrane protease YdiL (CAAX protease family)
MTMTATSQVRRPRHHQTAFLALILVAPFGVLLFHPGHLAVWLVISFCSVCYLAKSSFELFAHALFWLLLLIGLVAFPWPMSFVAPLAMYLCAYLWWPRFRRVSLWLVAGDFNRLTLAWMMPTILLSSGALLAWVFFFHPDLSDLASMVPAGGVIDLVLVGAAFSIFNAIWEEFIVKGIAWDTLTFLCNKSKPVNFLQAVLFGIMHAGGFPRGWVGILMATVYAYVLGIIKKRSGGLVAPIATHVFADATIFLILYFVAVGALPTNPAN